MNYDKKFRENEINITFSEGQLLCAICSGPWLHNSPRCLPCEISHIFCSECLEEFGRVNSLAEGSPFSCPICRSRHFWPNKGVKSFVLLSPFENCYTSSQVTETRSFKIENCLNNTSDALKLIMKISDALKQVEVRKNIELRRLNEEIEITIQRIEQKRQVFHEKLNKFYKQKENQLQDLLLDAKALLLFRRGSSDRFDENYIKMIQKLLTESDEIASSYALFIKSLELKELDVGDILISRLLVN